MDEKVPGLSICEDIMMLTWTCRPWLLHHTAWLCNADML